MSLLPGYGKHDEDEYDNFGVDWVVHYRFEDVGLTEAVDEFRTLIHDIEEAGLLAQVRPGHGASLLIFIKVPRDHLGNMIFKSRVKDWLFGITHTLPLGDAATSSIDAETPAEELRSVYHAVSWPKELGGAGINPTVGKWKNVTAGFPLHDTLANAELLRRWSRTTRLTGEDLDAIRALFGEKVAFYFAFIHCYSLFLIFPAACGVLCWMYCGPYSITFAVLNCLWCIVFVEYWKMKETDLSLRWNVKGVGALKVNRIQYRWDKEVTDPITGQIQRTFSARKQLLRQLLLLPFASVASVALGGLIVVTFLLEVFISVYGGPLKGYLEFLPTVLFSLSLPTITTKLTVIATRLTDYENYRTQDQYELAQTQKTFVMNFITSFLPTMLTAFVYVPFVAKIVPHLDIQVDPTRLQQEVIYLSVTGQVINFGEEFILPTLKRLLYSKYREYRLQHSRPGVLDSRNTDLPLVDRREEATFLKRARAEAEAEPYKVQDDILEMSVQFGYLALFGVAWPMVPLGFLVNNWVEVRGDFFKLSVESQRPPPIRADSIGPSLQGLEVLGWMGTLSTAAIVCMYRGHGGRIDVHLSTLLGVVFLAEQAYLIVRFAVRTGLMKIGSKTVREEEARQYAVRKSFLDAASGKGWRYSSSTSTTSSLSTADGRVKKPRVRFNERVDVYSSSSATVIDEESRKTDRTDGDGEDEKAQFCTTVTSSPIREVHDAMLYRSDREAMFWPGHGCKTADAGVKLIKALSHAKPAGVEKVSGKKA